MTMNASACVLTHMARFFGATVLLVVVCFLYNFFAKCNLCSHTHMVVLKATFSCVHEFVRIARRIRIRLLCAT